MFQFQILLAPVVAMLGLAFLLSSAMRHFHQTKYEQLAFGLLFGLTLVLGMTNPLSLGEGLIFDVRTLLTGAAVAFVGPIAGLITVAFGVICRIYVGGAGTASGLVGLVLAFCLAFAWAHFGKDRIKRPVLRDAFLGLAVTPSIIALFLLPFDLAMSLFYTILPTLLVCNVAGAIAIGWVFRREARYFLEAQEMQSIAQTDHLTNLLNRRGMDCEVDATKFDATRGHAVFYFDIDDFKGINDTYGHDTGDASLAIVAARIKDIIRGETVFARQGGDEFSLYVPGLEARDMQAVADRFCSAISGQKFSHNNQVFPVSISLGGYWSKQNLPLQDMINNADAQLLLAKRAGKNRAQVGFDRKENVSVVA
jgi:diguanylate cyclase